jgi:hypothetical protein
MISDDPNTPNAEPSPAPSASETPKPMFTPDDVIPKGARANRRKERVVRNPNGCNHTHPDAGKPVPPPATKAKAKEMIDQIVQEAAAAITSESATLISEKNKRDYEKMSMSVRANIYAILGPDIDAARMLFADKLLATAHKIHARIDAEVDDIPQQSLAFTMAVMVDKQEALRAKAGTSSRGAQVNIQVNQFGDGKIDREAIMRQLNPHAFAAVDAVTVTPTTPTQP